MHADPQVTYSKPPVETKVKAMGLVSYLAGVAAWRCCRRSRTTRR
ncbi:MULTISPECIES: hypothetical protein [unclassified Nonomuraea]